MLDLKKMNRNIDTLDRWNQTEHLIMKRLKSSPEDRDALRDSLQGLVPAQQRVMELLGGFNDDGAKSMKEVAEIFAITPQRVYQIRNKAIEKLRQYFDDMQEPTLTMMFNPAKHIYLHGTRKVRSVTGLIKAAGLLGPAAAFYSQEAAERGTRVHRGCLDVDRGNDIALAYDEMSYLDSYEKWRVLIRPVWTSLEEPKHSERYDFAGTADRLGTINGQPVIIDFKTGAAASWHGLQLALYDILYDDLPPMIRRRIVLHLRKDGRIPQAVEYHDHADYSTAFNLLSSRRHNDRDNDAQPQAEP